MNKKKKWIITAVVLVVFCAGPGPSTTTTERQFVRPGRRRQSDRARPADRSRPRRQRARRPTADASPTASPRWAACSPTRRWTSRSRPRARSSRSTSRRAPTVRKGELLAKVNDQPLAGPALALRGAAQTGRRPRLPPERPARKRTPSARRPANRPAPNWRCSAAHIDIVQFERRAHGAVAPRSTA